MRQSDPLESVYFITLPEDFHFESAVPFLDPAVPLPVQKKDGDAPGSFSPDSLTPEQILSGILTVLAYDRHNPHSEYYRAVVKKVRPDIRREMTAAAILKAKNEDWEFAEELFSMLGGLFPDDPAVALNTALFLDQRAESYRRAGLNEDADAYDADALRLYKTAAAAEPPLPDAFFNAGFFYLKKYDFRSAKDSFETFLALTCDTDDETLGENGVYKKERAQEIVNNINRDGTDDREFSAAYSLISSGREEEGIAHIRKFIEGNPGVWNAWFMLGWGLRRLERYGDARKAFSQALKSGGDRNADTYNELAICCMEEGDLKSARGNLNAALALEPENTKIISNLGCLALKEGKTDEARRYFTAVLEYAPDDKIALSSLSALEKTPPR